MFIPSQIYSRKSITQLWPYHAVLVVAMGACMYAELNGYSAICNYSVLVAAQAIKPGMHSLGMFLVSRCSLYVIYRPYSVSTQNNEPRIIHSLKKFRRENMQMSMYSTRLVLVRFEYRVCISRYILNTLQAIDQ